MNYFFKSLCVMTIFSLVLTLVYSVMRGEGLLWNAYGLFLLITLALTSVASVIGSRYRKLDISYLVLSSIGLFSVMLINTIVSLNPTNQASTSVVSTIIVLLLLVGGVVITSAPQLHTLNFRNSTLKAYKRRRYNKKEIARKGLLILLGLFLLIGVLMAYVLVTSTSSGLAEVAISQYSLFYSFIFLNVTGLFLKLSKTKKQSLLRYTVSGLGMGLFMVFALPFLSIPSLLNEAEDNYTEAFGNEWKTYGETVPYFRESPISLPAYIFGNESDNYTLTEDVLYYEGTDGVDDGLELRFDVYTPLEDSEELPGEGAVLIRIHGGGWDTGGKGAGNFAQMNKYFAAQGYVVFDVQYGLNDQDQFVEFAEVQEEVAGPFSIDDMVRHLGIFTTYLADHHEEYGADIDSVFISGGSAGGHLGNALGLSGNRYEDSIDSRLTVSGVIPFYPANGLAQYRDLDGEEGLVDPAVLVDENSPPALIYQGDKDAIVDPRVAELFRDAYLEQGNTESAIIWMPYGAHGSDLYFSGFYNQTFIYYMERFMYQYR
ncbi:MAG: carboxylesterase family protein [Alkalibacterium sp.]|nr:carboxylesterase family protein [Alkalibacterium sp.]